MSESQTRSGKLPILGKGGDGYDSWKSKFKASAIRRGYKNLLSDNKDDQQRGTAVNKKLQQELYADVVLSVDDSDVDTFAAIDSDEHDDCGTRAWQALVDKYDNGGIHSIYDLQSDYSSPQQPDEKCIDFLNRLVSQRSKLRKAGMVDEMTDKSLIINLTAGLRMEYNSVTSKWKKGDNMTPDDARKELLEHGVRIEHQLANEIKNDARPNESAAFVAAAATASNVELSKQVSELTALIAGMRRGRGKPRRQGFKGNCFECGGKGHVQKDCPNRQGHDPEDHDHASGFPAVAFPSVACFDWAYDDVQYNFDRDSLAEKSWPHEWPGEAPSLVPRISEHSETCDLLQVMGDDVLPDASHDTMCCLAADAATKRAGRNRRRRCTRRKTKAEAKEPLSVHVEEFSLPDFYQSKNAVTATCATSAAPTMEFEPTTPPPDSEMATSGFSDLGEFPYDTYSFVEEMEDALMKTPPPSLFGDNYSNYRGIISVGKAVRDGFTFVAGPAGVTLRHSDGPIAVTVVNQMYEIVSNPPDLSEGKDNHTVRLRLPGRVSSDPAGTEQEREYQELAMDMHTLVNGEPPTGSSLVVWSMYADNIRNLGSCFSKRLQRDLLRLKSSTARHD